MSRKAQVCLVSYFALNPEYKPFISAWSQAFPNGNEDRRSPLEGYSRDASTRDAQYLW